MDPLSILTASLSILASATTSAKTLLGIWRVFDPARDDIRGLRQDIDVFQNLLVALQEWLDSLCNVATDPDPGILQTLESIKNPVEHCDRLMKELISKAQFHQAPSYNLKRRMKWALFTRDDVHQLNHWLQSAKSSLQIALVLYTTRRISAISMNTAYVVSNSELEEPASPLNAAIGPLTIGTPQKIAPSVVQQNPSEFRSSFENFKMEVTAQLRNLSLQQTQSQQQFAILHNELARVAMLLEQTRSGNTELQDDGRSITSTTIDDVFFDCVSRLSGNRSSIQSFQSLSSSFGGSARYRFERSSAFYPELYSHSVLLHNRLFIEEILETTDNDIHYIECFLRLASSPRCWHRIHLHAYITNGGPIAKVLSFSNSVVWSGLVIPAKFNSALLAAIDDVELFEPVTSLQLTFTWEANEALVHDPRMTRAAEDVQEAAQLHEAFILQRLQDLGCTRYRESEIVTHRRITSSGFLVTIGESRYLEVKAPFVHMGDRLKNGFLEFVSDIMELHGLRDCPFIAKLRGIVLDDDDKHLKSYVRDGSYQSMAAFQAGVSSLGLQIPLSLKRHWMGQLAECFAWAHDHGIIIGPSVSGISVDGNAIIIPRRIGYASTIWNNFPANQGFEDRFSHMKAPSSNDFRLDIQCLGKILWNVSEEIKISSFCSETGCTIRPRYTCKTQHIQWDNVPFSAKTHVDIQNIIQRSLKIDTTMQPTAQEIVNQLYERVTETSAESTANEFIQTYADLLFRMGERMLTYCNECYSECSLSHYHCYICGDGDFDLCASCVIGGLHCWDPSHGMIHKRVTELGIVEEVV